ncbi:MAG: NAD(P)-binding protein [Betaproteobacteria bacterium]|nr:NAD(P)-binding protein [Betaproteobacteria bacterium]
MDARLICVIGGGISGLTFAALHRQNGGEILALEKNEVCGGEDGKSVVISAKSAAILKRAGAETATAPLSEIRVYFQDAPGGMTIGGGVLGCGVPHREIHQKLAATLGESLRAPAAVESIAQKKDGVAITFRTDGGVQEILAAAAVIACELPELPAPFLARTLDFQQGMITFTAAADNFPKGLAVEGFTRGGVAALVPRTDEKTGVILCAGEAAAGRLAALSDDALMERINDFFGGEFGLHSPGARQIYAPQTRYVSPLAAAKIATLGAGAAVLHPAGAQGLNMGLADAECLAAQLAGGENIETALAAYARRRTPAHMAMLAATGFLGMGGHFRQFPFRLAGGIGAAALSAAAFPWRRYLAEFVAGK